MQLSMSGVTLTSFQYVCESCALLGALNIMVSGMRALLLGVLWANWGDHT